MNKNVILFLTTPNSASRIKMCLENFKQLEKLGYDIITLTTTDLLPEYIYDKSKYVIHDYNDHKIYKKDYYNYFKESVGFGYFFYEINIHHRAKLFNDTHFPSVMRNTRTLIHFAESMSYEKYFFVEDDHYFHDDDLNSIRDFFDKLDENNMIIFSFKRYQDQSAQDYVYCSWFHFGKVKSSNEIFKNFAYTRNDFLNDKHLYLHFYEYIFKSLIDKYKLNDMSILEIKDFFTTYFKNSKLNRIYSNNNFEDDSRCNIIYNHKEKTSVFYYKSSNLDMPVNVKIFINKKLVNQFNLPPNCWYYWPIQNDQINLTEIVVNDISKKSFENLETDKIIYNGEMTDDI